MEELQDGGGFWGPVIEIQHSMNDQETSQNMKQAAEPVAKHTQYQYEKSKEEENSYGEHESNDDHPNAVDFHSLMMKMSV